MCTKGLLEQKGQSRSTYYIAGENFISSRLDQENSRGDGENGNAIGEMCRADGEMCRADGENSRADGENGKGDGENGNAIGEMCRADREMCRGGGIQMCRADGENGNAAKENGNAIGENGNAARENGIALPDELLERCRNLKKWESSKKMKDLIVELCTYEPLSINEIANILHRKPHSIRYLYVSSLIEDRRLFFTIPEMIKHPNQKYTAVKNK